MYDSILEYIVNADLFYRLWMVGEMQHPTPSSIKDYQTKNSNPIAQPRGEWFPALVDQIDDAPAGIRVGGYNHQLDAAMRFHSGNKLPTVSAGKMEIFWGDDNLLDKPTPVRTTGPAHIILLGLKMWHHQDTLNRRRGDAIICEQATFQWNTQENSKGAFREYGPFRVVIRNFRAAYFMGDTTDASYEHMGVSWSTNSGARLGEEKVSKILKKNSLDVNYLRTDSVFVRPSDEFIFWDEAGR